MKMRSALAITAAASVAVGAAACKSGGGKTIGPVRMALAFRAPVTGSYTDVTSVCAGTRSWLLSFDRGQGYDLRFLVDSAGHLVGCGGGVSPCADDHISTRLDHATRVMLEGLDVTPAQFGASAHDVVCRGVADPRLDATALASSSGSLAVRFDLLRVGAFNGLFAAGGPTERHGAATLAVPSDAVTTRTAAGGVVVVGGGDAAAGGYSRNVYEFHPGKLAFDAPTQALATGRNYLTATAYQVGSGSAVLFAGGYDGSPSNAVDYYGVGGTSPANLGTLNAPRGAALAVYLPSIASFGQGVVLAGGCNADGNFFGSSDPKQGSWEVFLPDASCPGVGGHFCEGASSLTLLGGQTVLSLCKTAGGRFDDGSGTPAIWFAGGYVTTNGASAGAGVTANAWKLSLGGAPGTLASSPPLKGAPRRSAAGVEVAGGGVAVLGGCDQPPQAPDPLYHSGLADWAYFTGGIPPVATAQMQEGRNGLTATALLDGEILAAGGVNVTYGLGVVTADLLQPAGAGLVPIGVFGTAWTFVAAPPMAAARYSHEATRIDGSLSWINGAVLITGGGQNSEPPELFVPSYYCDASNRPIRLTDGSPLTGLVDACDRGRTGIVNDDPLAP